MIRAAVSFRYEKQEGLTVPSRIAAALALVLACHPSVPAESQGSIQGVWRPVSRSIPATTNPGDRSDPFAHVPGGNSHPPAAGVDDFHREALQQDDGHRDDTAPNNSGSDAGQGDGRRAPGAMGTVPGQCRHL